MPTSARAPSAKRLDALRVMGVDPVRALMVPRVLAATVVALLLCLSGDVVGLVGAFFFSVFFQHVTPGAFVAGMTLLAGIGDVVVHLIKAGMFGLTAGLIAVTRARPLLGAPLRSETR